MPSIKFIAFKFSLANKMFSNYESEEKVKFSIFQRHESNTCKIYFIWNNNTHIKSDFIYIYVLYFPRLILALS